MNLLIVAAGLGSRVSNITFNIIPKYLISIDHFYGLYHIINYWKKYVESFYLVIHPSFIPLTEYYIKNFHQNLNIKIIPYEESDGTAYTIKSLLNNNYELFKNNPLCITWCDIYPDLKNTINFNKIDKDVCIFTHGNECRYKYIEEVNLIENVGKTGGDIIGIYFIRNVDLIVYDENIIKNTDIVDYLDKYGSLQKYDLEKINDYGDELKLNNLRKEYENIKINCRHFNELIIDKEKKTVFKRGLDEQGKIIIKNEILWYKYLKEHKSNNDFILPIPKILFLKQTSDFYVIEYLENYITLNKYLDNFKENENNIRENIIENLIEKINLIHSLENKKMDKIQFMWDFMYETETKIKERLKDIQPILNSIGDIKYVNGKKIKSFKEVFEKVKNVIFKYFDSLNNEYIYHIIHGDLNFSNIMIHPENKDIKFIDPRGIFGKTKIFGSKEYDYAKILYAISGYDYFQQSFNFQPTQLQKDNFEIQFNISSIQLSKQFLDKHFKKIHYALLIIIWLGLAQYTKNNYWKCICSYYHALSLEYLLD